jgi:hypothetical protein
VSSLEGRIACAVDLSREAAIRHGYSQQFRNKFARYSSGIRTTCEESTRLSLQQGSDRRRRPRYNPGAASARLAGFDLDREHHDAAPRGKATIPMDAARHPPATTPGHPRALTPLAPAVLPTPDSGRFQLEQPLRSRHAFTTSKNQIPIRGSATGRGSRGVWSRESERLLATLPNCPVSLGIRPGCL